MRYTISQFLLFFLLTFCQITWASLDALNGWNLHDATGMPDWIRFAIEHRTRYETLSNTFKNNRNGGDQVIAFRTRVFFEFSYDQFSLGAEFIDSRIDLEDSGTPVNNSLVNEVALLQAYLAWQSGNFFNTGLQAQAKFGRQTMDIGSRRLVASNRYRNTVNNFNGLDFILQSGNQWLWRNFVVLPVTRQPTNPNQIRAGVIEFDEENFNTIFAGSFLSLNHFLTLDSRFELYFFQLSEQDSSNIPTKNRNLSTPGFRFYRKPHPEHFDYELEANLQTGTSHATRLSSDTNKLNHFSYFGHFAIGYTFDAPWQPRLMFQYDYASGDKNPNDGNNGRYETLYGARRFEFGPTSIWGAFARANINSPGIRLKFKPLPGLTGFIAHRAYWLAEKKDTWVGSGLRDPNGQSGRYIGQQMEARLRWKAIPRLVTLETGWAHLFKGEFAKKAPGSPANKNDADYFYFQTTVAF